MVTGADEAYDRLHGVDGHTQATPREEPCPVCGGSMRSCECMDDPFARKCRMCGCGTDGAGECPCGCIDSEGVGTGAGEGATGQDTGTAWVTRSEDCPEAPAQARPLGPDVGEHDPRCYQRTGVPDDMPANLCDCRVLRMVDAEVER